MIIRTADGESVKDAVREPLSVNRMEMNGDCSIKAIMMNSLKQENLIQFR